MSKIKTKQKNDQAGKGKSKGKVSSSHKPAQMRRRMKQKLIKSKGKLKNRADDGQITPEEYAGDQLKYKAEETLYVAGQEGKAGLKKAKEKAKERVKEHRREKQEERIREMMDRDGTLKDEAVSVSADPPVDAPTDAQVDVSERSDITPKQGEAMKAGSARRKTQESQAKASALPKDPTEKPNMVISHGHGQDLSPEIQISQVSTKISALPKTVRQREIPSQKTDIKSFKPTIKREKKFVKTADRSATSGLLPSRRVGGRGIKTAEKMTGTSAKGTHMAAQSVKSGKTLAQKTSSLVKKSAKTGAKGVAAAVKVALSTIKSLIALLLPGGTILLVIISVICAIGMLVGSVFGIFFSSEKSSSRQDKTMQQVVREINGEYQDKIAEARALESYEEVVISGSSAVWREVLAVYAVKVNLDPDPEAGQEVATLDEGKIQTLKDIFWSMNEVESEIREVEKIIYEEEVDEEGNITIVEVERRMVNTLYITIRHKTAMEMAQELSFSNTQQQNMAELLSEEYRSLWAAVLYGIHEGEDQIVAVALSQLGNEGGEPYWSHFGFSSRIEWCACFVTWCADECGYVADGIMPNVIGCVAGMNWFKARDQWIDGNNEPVPGMIIYFDWDDPEGEFGPQDGKPDHVGIVEKVVDGIIYTVEGNSGDSVRQNQYPVGEHVILGFGVVEY